MRGKEEAWRARSSTLTPRRLSWISRISRCLVALSMTSSTPTTPTWSRSTLSWKMYKFCWRLLGFSRAPTGRTEVSLSFIYSPPPAAFDPFHLPLNFRKTRLHCQQTQTTKGWVHSTKHHCDALSAARACSRPTYSWCAHCSCRRVWNDRAFTVFWTIFHLHYAHVFFALRLHNSQPRELRFSLTAQIKQYDIMTGLCGCACWLPIRYDKSGHIAAPSNSV